MSDGRDSQIRAFSWANRPIAKGAVYPLAENRNCILVHYMTIDPNNPWEWEEEWWEEEWDEEGGGCPRVPADIPF